MQKPLVFSPFHPATEAEIISIIGTREIIDGYKKTYHIDVSRIYNELDYVYICQCPVTFLNFFYPLHLEGDALFYKQMSLHEWYYTIDRWEHDEAIKYFKDDQIILEIGSGDGVFLEKLKAVKKISYTGLELNELAIQKAKIKGVDLLNETLHSHARNHAKKYDVVCSFQVLEHISDVNQILTDSIQVLNENGKLIIAVPNNDARFIKHNVHESKVLNMPPHHVNLFTEQSLIEIGNFFNLKLVALIKEPLQKNHVDVFMFNSLAHLISHRSFILRTIWKLNIHKLFRPLILALKNRITGHTIIAIFEKNKSH